MANKIIKTSNIPLLDNVIHYLKKLALETVNKSGLDKSLIENIIV